MPTHREVVSMWARRSKPAAKGYAVFFEGDRIYSWGTHFCIARHIEHNGQQAVLFTTRSYSTSTAGHMSLVRRHIPHDVPVFHVEHPEQGPTVDDLVGYRTRIIEANDKAKRARVYKDLHLANAERIEAEASEFAKFFGL